MSPIVVGLIGLVVLMILIFASIPLAFCFAIVGFVGLWILVGINPALQMMGSSITYSQVADYTFTVIPLFMLMGQVAGEGGMISEAFVAARRWFGWLPGGLALSVTSAAIVFGAVSGSGTATIITMTKTAWPEMKKYKYDPALSLGACISTGGIDNLIPPSIPMIIFAMLSGESIGRLFIGGIIPGLVVAFLMMVSIITVCKLKPGMAPPAPHFTWKERFLSLKPVWAILLLIIVVLGGIWAGIDTPNEAAGIGAAGALIIGFSKRKLNFDIVYRSFKDVVIMTAAISVMFIAIGIFNSFLAVSHLPQALATWVIGLDVSPRTIVWVIVFTYLILGIPLEATPIMLLTVPIFVPLLNTLHVDLVWFGILAIISIGLAGVTPPVGNPMFIVHGLVRKDNIPLSTIFKGASFYCIPIVIGLILFILFPELITWLPSTMMDATR